MGWCSAHVCFLTRSDPTLITDISHSDGCVLCGLQNNDAGADGDAIEQIDHVLVEKSDAAKADMSLPILIRRLLNHLIRTKKN
jgi:hypothetical protein